MKQKLLYRRILLKLSGEVLEGEKSAGIDFSLLERLCNEILCLQKLHLEIVLVIGGGNFWRYRNFKTSFLDRVHSDSMGMLATVMNALALQDAFRYLGSQARALSALHMPAIIENYYRDKALAYLKQGEIVICAGGTGNPFFTTDSTAALRAAELKCDVVLKATKVDYVYDKDPVCYPDAIAFKKLSYQQVLEQQLEFMDLSAISLCQEVKIPIIVFNLQKKGNIEKAVKNKNIGTLIS